MNKAIGTVSQKIKGNIFMATDVISMEFTFEKLLAKGEDKESLFDQYPVIFNETRGFLTTGPTWEFNPTLKNMRASGSNSLELDDDKLANYVKNNSGIDIEELDVNNNVAVVRIPIELLIANARMLPDDLIEKSSFHTVRTLFGDIEL
jgi:hypothetical protein